METWLNNLAGFSGKTGDPASNKFEAAQAALNAFQRMGTREYDYLVQKLASPTGDKIQYGAIRVAFKIAGTNATPAIPKLIELFGQEGQSTIPTVSECLAGIGTNAVFPLMRALTDNNVKVRQGAAFTLGRIGPSAKPAVPLLLERLKIDELQVCPSIIWALGLIGQYPDLVVPVLIQKLQSDDQNIRCSAVFAVSGFGDASKDAAPLLFNLLNDANDNVRKNAAGAIMRMNLGKEYIPLLATNASNPDLSVRCCIAQALGKQGAYTNEVFPILLKLTKDSDRYVRESAGITINQMGYSPPVDVVKLRGLNQ